MNQLSAADLDAILDDAFAAVPETRPKRTFARWMAWENMFLIETEKFGKTPDQQARVLDRSSNAVRRQIAYLKRRRSGAVD